MKRPIGVTILALLLLLNGVRNGILAATLYSRPPANRYDVVGILFGAMVGAVASFAFGIGIWFLQKPAWWGLLLVTGIPLGRGLISAAGYLMQNPRDFGKYYGNAFVLRTLALGIVVLYLIRPNVKRAFGNPSVDSDVFYQDEPNQPE